MDNFQLLQAKSTNRIYGLFSCPTITTLEQRFQFYTNGNNNFLGKPCTELDAREHINNDSDRYQFTAHLTQKFL
jgi:hypothetical protein